MPQIYPKRVASFSTECKEFPASNLLKGSTFNKWRSEKGGTANEVVELDFGEPVEVTRLDIGNNGSAFVEVLVRRSASSASPMVFLPCSSFMSPSDAKNETNLTRVRVFSGDQLYDVAAKQKWDIFRIVCTQPFNKTLPYGISFISFHTSLPIEAPSTNCVNLLANDEEIDGDSSDFRPGALFQATKSKPSETQPATSAAKAAITVAEKLRATQQAFLKNLLDAPASGSAAPNTVGAVRPTVHSISNHAHKINPISSKAADSSSSKGDTSSSTPDNTLPGTSRAKSAKHTEPSDEQKPKPSASISTRESKTKIAGLCRRPLSGVVFTLSGYQNPLRSDLRQKALQLGAQFRQDWGPDCTHLICAFANTPKFRQVVRKGIIVSGKWIEKCYDTKSKEDWRPFRVGRAPSPPPVGNVDEERDEHSGSGSNSAKPSTSNKLNRRRRVGSDDEWTPVSEGSDVEESEECDYDSEDEDAEDTNGSAEDGDDDGSRRKGRKRGKKTTGSRSSKRKPAPKTPVQNSRSPVSKASRSVRKNADPEEEDTDDEIQRVMDPATQDDEDTKPTASESSLSVPATNGKKSQVTGPEELPSMFENTHFFIHKKAIPSDEERIIQRLIVAFSGTLHQYMSSDVQFVVTRSVWNEEFDTALADNANLIFVRPDWILACDEQARRVPFQKYLVVG